MELIKPYTFDLDSQHTVLVVLDMQNATCIRHAGYGKALADAGEPDAQRAFFERVEKIVIPRQQQLPDYFRDNCPRGPLRPSPHSVRNRPAACSTVGSRRSPRSG